MTESFYNKRFNLIEVAALFRVSRDKVRRWMQAGYLDHTVTPLGYSIRPEAVLDFLGRRRRAGARSLLSMAHLENGELVTVPTAARRFKMSDHALYRAITRGEVAVFDLSENERTGLRVVLSDVEAVLLPEEEPDRPDLSIVEEHPQEARSEPTPEPSRPVVGYLEDLAEEVRREIEALERQLANKRETLDAITDAAEANRRLAERLSA